MNSMTTISQVLNKLYKQGYTIDFNLNYPEDISRKNTLLYAPEDFIVDKHYRFEGASDPGDEAIVYAISSSKHHLKGVIVNGYGISSDHDVNKIIASLNTGTYTYPSND